MIHPQRFAAPPPTELAADRSREPCIAEGGIAEGGIAGRGITGRDGP
ncbi:MAG TPA: hypothetical protein VHZ02_11400 [Acidimicrobiales bacterium]|nr:hypothetical protein [Acidimicrobiales bacterium]